MLGERSVVNARRPLKPQDAIAHFHATDSGADRLDLTGDVASKNREKVVLQIRAGGAAEHVQIVRMQRGSSDANLHLPPPGARGLDLPESGSVVSFQNVCAHASPRR